MPCRSVWAGRIPAEREAVAGSPSRTFPCSYEPLSARDPRCRRRNEAAAPIASSSFAAAVRVLGRLRDGPRPALRGRALRAPPRKSWPAPFFAGNSGLSTLSRVLLGDRTCLCLPNTRPRTRPPRSPARRRPRRCRRRSSLREASAQRRSPNHGAREILIGRDAGQSERRSAAYRRNRGGRSGLKKAKLLGHRKPRPSGGTHPSSAAIEVPVNCESRDAGWRFNGAVWSSWLH